jgi:hypothetical protein
VLRTAREQGPWPGLILEWRRVNSGGWAARVVYVPDHRSGRSVEDWFAPTYLRPVDAWPSSATQEAARTGVDPDPGLAHLAAQSDLGQDDT